MLPVLLRKLCVWSICASCIVVVKGKLLLLGSHSNTIFLRFFFLCHYAVDNHGKLPIIRGIGWRGTADDRFGNGQNCTQNYFQTNLFTLKNYIWPTG